LALGQPDLAGEAAREAIDTARRLDSRDDEVTGLTTLVAIEAERGAWPEAEVAIAALLPLLERHDAEGITPLVHALRARVAASQGDLESAQADLRGVGNLDALWAHTRLRTEIALGRALAAMGRPDEARGHLQRALSSAEANGSRYYQLMAHHWLADLLSGAPSEESQLARHRRIAQAVARSLSANLEPAEAATFLGLRWGEPAGGTTG
jgi:tetratricopeptide (TPR) repeat protein